MTLGSPSSRSARLLSMACLVIVLCVLSPSPHADNTPKPTILWTQKLPREVLAIVNADANRVTIQEPGEEEVGMANMSSDWLKVKGVVAWASSVHGGIRVTCAPRPRWPGLATSAG